MVDKKKAKIVAKRIKSRVAKRVPSFGSYIEDATENMDKILKKKR